MKVSARNYLPGTIASVTDGVVNGWPLYLRNGGSWNAAVSPSVSKGCNADVCNHNTFTILPRVASALLRLVVTFCHVLPLPYSGQYSCFVT
ncbi:MAG: hypothetical protein JWL76_2467 [Thermoleophilia bacterium]|nr:hypothetical protein [Thermoleophilia bacterium]